MILEEKIKALEGLMNQEVLSEEEYEKCVHIVVESNSNQIHLQREGYNAGDVIWNSNYVVVTYMGIHKEGNYWGIKMLFENKSEIPISVKYKDISMNGFVFSGTYYIMLDLPPEMKAFEDASIMFEDLKTIGVKKIEEMGDIKLKLFSENEDYKKLEESDVITLHIQEYKTRR